MPEPQEDPALTILQNQQRVRRELLAQMEAVDEFKKAVAAMVAGLVADGFTDEQARAIVAGFWHSTYKKKENDSA